MRDKSDRENTNKQRSIKRDKKHSKTTTRMDGEQV